ncbi:MAG: hypothetical protein Q8878_04750 [Bacillota bacterium]|nr:hypothetical protein [Bacillota bacterium]
MATQTTNYSFVKPADSDTADVSVINANMDIIDTQLKSNAASASAAQSTANTAQSAANAAIPKSAATAADQALVSTASGTWAVKTLAQFKTWLAITSSNISDFAAAVRSTVLTGLSTATNTAVTATDTVLSAFGKLQAQITANLSTLTSHTGNASNPHGTTAAQVGAVPSARTVNGKQLSADIALYAADVGAETPGGAQAKANAALTAAITALNNKVLPAQIVTATWNESVAAGATVIKTIPHSLGTVPFKIRLIFVNGGESALVETTYDGANYNHIAASKTNAITPGVWKPEMISGYIMSGSYGSPSLGGGSSGPFRLDSIMFSSTGINFNICNTATGANNLYLSVVMEVYR